MHLARQGSLISVRTFPIIASVCTATGGVAFLLSGASLVLTLTSFGLAAVYAGLTATSFVRVRRVGDSLLVRRGFKHFDVLVEGSALKRTLRAGPNGQGSIAALVLLPNAQSGIELVRVNGFTPGGALRSVQGIGDSIAPCLGIPYAREFSDSEVKVLAHSASNVRFVLIALFLLLVGLGGIAVLWHLS